MAVPMGRSVRDDADMETLIALATPVLYFGVPIAIAASIRALAGDDGDTTLVPLFAPLVGSDAAADQPAPEPHEVPWFVPPVIVAAML